MLGPDISYAQGHVDWESFRADFVIIRAGGYGSIVDDQYNANRAGATARQIERGFYYFAGGGDPRGEAEHFHSIVGDLATGEIIALDWETEHADPVGWCLAFLQRAEELFGIGPDRAAIYLNLDRLGRFDWAPISTRGNPLWAAGYWNDLSPNHSFPTGSWPAYTLWQYSDAGRVPGISGDVDMNIGSLNNTIQGGSGVNIGRFQPELKSFDGGMRLVCRVWYDDFPGEQGNVNSWINLLLGKSVHMVVQMTGADRWERDVQPDSPETHLHFDQNFPDRDRRGSFKVVITPLDGQPLNVADLDVAVEYDWMH